MTFKDKVIWITGASSGIGESFARAFHKEGAKLILSSRRKEVLEEVKNSLEGDTSNVHILTLDLADSGSLPAKAEEAKAIFGRIDVLMNNGGVSQRAYAIELEMDTVRELMEVNFFGAVALTKAVLPDMIERKDGYIITVSSVAGKIGTRSRAGYAASKHALQGYFNSLRQEMYDHNVKVTLLLPGFIQTNITKNALRGDGTPFNRMGNAHSNAMDADQMVDKVFGKIKSQQEEIIVTGFKEGAALAIQRISSRLLNKVLKGSKVT